MRSSRYRRSEIEVENSHGINLYQLLNNCKHKSQKKAVFRNLEAILFLQATLLSMKTLHHKL